MRSLNQESQFKSTAPWISLFNLSLTRKLWTFISARGADMSWIALTLAGSILVPLLLTMKQSNLLEAAPKRHLLQLSFNWYSFSRLNTFPKLTIWHSSSLILQWCRLHIVIFHGESYHETRPSSIFGKLPVHFSNRTTWLCSKTSLIEWKMKSFLYPWQSFWYSLKTYL